MIMLILTVDLRYRPNRKKEKMFYILLAAVVWVSTLRVRAFLYVITYAVLYYFLIEKEKKIRMNWKTALVTAVAMYIFSIDQINLYFVNASGARASLARYGFVTMLRFFSLGSGFATFGTDAAVTYYSTLYYEYGFDKVWGLSPAYPLFTHDNYWPAVMAQFGVVGLVLMGVLVIAGPRIWSTAARAINMDRWVHCFSAQRWHRQVSPPPLFPLYHRGDLHPDPAAVRAESDH